MIDWDSQNQSMLHRIFMPGGHLEQAVDRFKAKNASYKGQQMFLGAKAQFCDVNRKFWKLHKMVWLGEADEFEQPIEVIDDMIGHLLMLKDMIDGEALPLGRKGSEVEGWTDGRMSPRCSIFYEGEQCGLTANHSGIKHFFPTAGNNYDGLRLEMGSRNG